MKKYSLRVLQMAYLEFKLKRQKREGEVCIYCWQTGCDCNTNFSIKDDLFLNLSAEELNYV